MDTISTCDLDLLAPSGKDLDADILYSLLGDPTFVEYLNSFLLLPAFSNQLYFNKETGYFEQVHSRDAMYWEGNETPSSSFSTLYLPEEAIGASLDKMQSWQWVVQHRLPLFFRSDLYSEYKISKLLASTELLAWKSPRGIQEATYHDLEGSVDDQSQRSSDAKMKLPEINELGVSKSLQVVLSKSDAELDTKPGRRVRWHRSLSVEPGALPTYLSFSQKSSNTSVPSSGTMENFLSTKSGMNAFWKFLQGKAGEKNLLFWLDAERIKYYSDDTDQQRLLKELRERYFNSGSALELPAKTITKLNLGKSGNFSMEQIAGIQEAMVTKLKEYWCPQFLLHCSQDDSAIRPASCLSLRASGAFRSCSTAPAALQDTGQTGYARVVTPVTPTLTPTYRKLPRQRPKSSSCLYQRSSTTIKFNVFSPRSSSNLIPAEPAVETSQFLAVPSVEKNDSPLKRKKWTRKIWGIYTKSALTLDGEAQLPVPATEKYNQLAKYSFHHIPDPESKCASRLEGSGSTTLCTNKCKVLSVSGTPVHADSFGAVADSSTVYEQLLNCLATEKRKAGGYFLNYLGKLEDSVYMRCLLFWREVQEYKTLFVKKTFSPCAVEMKAKGVFGRYISECCDESIQCPPRVTTTVSTTLWPAYEDLFDEAEEYALDMLLTQWNDLCSSEDVEFQKLDTVELAADLEGVSTDGSYSPSPTHYTTTMGGRSCISESTTGSSSSEAISLDMVLNNSVELEHFKMFLNKNCAAEDLMCWMDIEGFRGVPLTDKYIRNVKAKQLRKQYFNKQYFFGPHSPATKEAQRQTRAAGGISAGARLPGRPRTPLFREAQKHIRARLEKRWLIQFINSPGFLERNKKTAFSKSSITTKSSQYVSEHTFINSHQAILFRKFLLSRDSSDTYLHYLRIKSMGDVSPFSIKYPKADLEFWYEVQKYKGMFHAHTMETILDNKATAVNDCFFNSTVPPQLQIDVPLSLAEQVTRKPCGPYLFRETQAVIFKLLYNAWKEYKNFIQGLDDKLLQKALDRLEKDSMESLRRKREQEERARQDEERRRLMLPHFESREERELRLKHEKEMEEFGPTAVEFRLSTPDTSNYIYYTDIPRSHSVLQITKIDDEKQLQHEAIEKSKSEAQIKDLETVDSESQAPRRRSARKKSSKKGLKREKGRYAEEPIILEMISNDKKEKGKRQVQVRTEAKRLKVGESKVGLSKRPLTRESTTCKDGRISVLGEQFKPTRLPSSTPALNKASPILLGTNLLGTGSESKVGLSKRRPLTREKYYSDPSVQGGMNMIRMNVSKSQYVCGSGLPEDQSYLNITSQHFY